jgi:hypothetical protein
MKEDNWEKILTQALAPSAEPDEYLNQRISNQLKERIQMKPKYRIRLSASVLAFVMLLALSVTAYAAVQLLSPKQVAEHVGDRALAEAFASKDALQLNQSIEAKDYQFTLHGLVSGAGLSQLNSTAESLEPDRTYAVVSIARQDGKPMPATSDPAYGQENFFVSPLIKGQKPWLVNIVTMGGSYHELVRDGVQYRLIECDPIEMFADRGVYLAVSSGTAFYSNEAFNFDENTGEIAAREDYSGASAIFTLPLDATRSDHDKAEEYLNTLLNPDSQQNTKPGSDAADKEAALEDHAKWLRGLKMKVHEGKEIGETLPGSIQELANETSGKKTYSYDGWTQTINPDDYFQKDQVGFSDQFGVSGDDNGYQALLFHRDADGVITGRIVILKDAPAPLN